LKAEPKKAEPKKAEPKKAEPKRALSVSPMDRGHLLTEHLYWLKRPDCQSRQQRKFNART
ncbi:MAG: hypothetical protein AAFP03_18370, partial [Cyanobacteria bacterium J06598_3]